MFSTERVKRGVAVRDWNETEIFDYKPETRPRPKPSKIFSRPRRDRDLGFRVRGWDRDQDKTFKTETDMFSEILHKSRPNCIFQGYRNDDQFISRTNFSNFNKHQKSSWHYQEFIQPTTISTIKHAIIVIDVKSAETARQAVLYGISLSAKRKREFIFIALHVMQTRYSEENSVRPSVCPSVRLSVTRVIPDKTEERSVQIFIPYERIFILVFWEKEWLVGATPSNWNFGSTDPRWSEIADFQPIIARSSSAVTRSEKSSNNANRKSTTRFPMSLRRSSYVAPKGPQKRKKADFY